MSFYSLTPEFFFHRTIMTKGLTDTTNKDTHLPTIEKVIQKKEKKEEKKKPLFEQNLTTITGKRARKQTIFFDKEKNGGRTH